MQHLIERGSRTLLRLTPEMIHLKYLGRGGMRLIVVIGDLRHHALLPERFVCAPPRSRAIVEECELVGFG